jgi:DNA polymerase III delta subunit
MSAVSRPDTAPAAPIAYYFGDDTWSLESAASTFARRVAGLDGPALERWHAVGATTTASLIGERVATAALFGGGTAAIVAEPGPLIRSNALRAELISVLTTVAPGNALIFLDPMDRWPKDGRLGGDRAALAKAIEAAGGEVRGFAAPTAGGMARWIEDRAAERGVVLERGAAQALAERVGAFVREGDVDRRRQGQLAVQELDKLALYRLGAPVTADDVRELVAEAVPASTWALLDAVAWRRSRDAADLLDRVLDVTPEPVVLVHLHRRLRELIEVADLVATGTPTRDLPRVLKLHPFRAETLAKQAAGWSLAELEAALDGLLELDATVKGAGRAPVDEPTRRLAFTLWLATTVARTGAQPDGARVTVTAG